MLSRRPAPYIADHALTPACGTSSRDLRKAAGRLKAGRRRRSRRFFEMTENPDPAIGRGGQRSRRCCFENIVHESGDDGRCWSICSAHRRARRLGAWNREPQQFAREERRENPRPSLKQARNRPGGLAARALEMPAAAERPSWQLRPAHGSPRRRLPGGRIGAAPRKST